MIVARQTFQAKYGRGDELVALFKEFTANMREAGISVNDYRLLTDASGPFFTVVSEIEVESLAAWEDMFREAMKQDWIGDWSQRVSPLIESGRRDFYNIVE